jgi:hypothetical protein
MKGCSTIQNGTKLNPKLSQNLITTQNFSDDVPLEIVYVGWVFW